MFFSIQIEIVQCLDFIVSYLIKTICSLLERENGCGSGLGLELGVRVMVGLKSISTWFVESF